MLISTSNSAGHAAQRTSKGYTALRSSQREKNAALSSQHISSAHRKHTHMHSTSSTIESTIKMRLEAWKKTGIASLRDLKLKEKDIPSELFQLGDCIRILDLGGNQLSSLPLQELALLRNLQKLRLSINRIDDTGMPWESLFFPLHGCISQLIVLVIDSNRLTRLPDDISRLHKLQKLSFDNNMVKHLPDSIGELSELRSVSGRNNKLTSLPVSLHRCLMLEEVDFSKNMIDAIPHEYSSLKKLRILMLNDTKIWCIPPAVLRECTSLNTLSVHNCPMSIEDLRETDGFDVFEEKRRLKYDKQVDMKVLPDGGGFDQGADVEEWEHWK